MEFAPDGRKVILPEGSCSGLKKKAVKRKSCPSEEFISDKVRI
jgi:hypothetical protein